MEFLIFPNLAPELIDKLITEIILEKTMRWVLLTICILANSKQLSDVPLALNFDLTTI